MNERSHIDRALTMSGFEEERPTTSGQTAGYVRALDWFLRAVAAAGMGVDAYVHLKVAGEYDVVKATVSQGQLFRVEAVVAALVGLLVLTGRRLWLAAVALVAVSAVAVLLVNTYHDVGVIGPVPDMYEPIWFPSKRLALVGESLAAVAALAALALRAVASPRTARSTE